jgi:hypothetical protein
MRARPVHKENMFSSQKCAMRVSALKWCPWVAQEMHLEQGAPHEECFRRLTLSANIFDKSFPSNLSHEVRMQTVQK